MKLDKKKICTDCREERRVLETRLRELQQETLERRAAVDALSARMATLSRLQRFQAGRRAAEEAALRAASEVVAVFRREAEAGEGADAEAKAKAADGGGGGGGGGEK